MIVRISVNGDEVVSEINMSLLRQQLNFSYDTDRPVHGCQCYR